MRRTLALLLFVLCFAGSACKNDNGTGNITQIGAPIINGFSPATAYRGAMNIEGRIYGKNLNSIVSIDLGPGVFLGQFSVISNEQLYVFFSVSPDAPPGPKTVVVTTTEGTASSDKFFSINNERIPEAKFVFHPGLVYKDKPIEFDASRSSADGSITQYSWNFGDGRHTSGKIVEHKFSRADDFKVTLRVTDSNGLQSEAWEILDVTASKPPIAAYTMAPSSGNTNTLFHFDATGSRDPDGTIVNYFWAFGDGASGGGAVIDHQFRSSGDLPVVLTVGDNTGVKSFTTRVVRISGSSGGPPPPPPTGGGSSCTNQVGSRSPDLYGTVLSADKGTKTIVIQLYNSASCSTAFYKCGDIKLGGDGIGGTEQWYGTICSMSFLGNNTFEVKVGGNTKYWPNAGQKNVYLHWQTCGSGANCSGI